MSSPYVFSLLICWSLATTLKVQCLYMGLLLFFSSFSDEMTRGKIILAKGFFSLLINDILPHDPAVFSCICYK